MLSDKQKKIVEFALRNDNQITKDQAVLLIDDYYANGRKHVGDVLSRMVKRNVLTRVKNGHFVLRNLVPVKQDIIVPNQINLF